MQETATLERPRIADLAYAAPVRRLPRHLSYANVASTLALLFAMGGSAIAASHYLINSTHQINPKVIRALRGKQGRRGESGTAGPAGVKGAEGQRGLEGQRGSEGQRGPEGASALTPLGSGISESGVFSTGARNTGPGLLLAAFQFPKPLLEPIPVSHVFYTPAGTPISHCAGPGEAEAGYLCIYSAVKLGLGIPTLFDPETNSNQRTGTLGFGLIWTSTTTKEGEVESDSGSYTVTAP
jgi:hypothetical protein